MERTFVLIKPEGVQQGLINSITEFFEHKGHKMVCMKFLEPSTDLLKKYYANLAGKSFLQDLLKYMRSGPVIPMIFEGENVVEYGREISDALGSDDKGRRLVHAAASIEKAEQEISLWFDQTPGLDQIAN